MKKTYIVPQVEIMDVMAEQMMAISLWEEPADPKGEVLTKEDNGWDIWGEE